MSDLVQHHRLDVAAAGKGLRHARGVHIKLDGRRPAGQHVALKIRWNVQRKGVVPASIPASAAASGIMAGVMNYGG